MFQISFSWVIFKQVIIQLVKRGMWKENTRQTNHNSHTKYLPYTTLYRGWDVEASNNYKPQLLKLHQPLRMRLLWACFKSSEPFKGSGLGTNLGAEQWIRKGLNTLNFLMLEVGCLAKLYTNWKFKFKIDLLNALALMWNRMENQVLKNEFTLSYLIYLKCNQHIMFASKKVILNI